MLTRLADYQSILCKLFHDQAADLSQQGSSSIDNNPNSTAYVPSLRWKLLSRGYLTKPITLKVTSSKPSVTSRNDSAIEVVMETNHPIQSNR